MIKKLCLSIVLVSLLAALPAQESGTSVAVLPIANRGQSRQLQVPAETVPATISLTLRLMARYSVIDASFAPDEYDEDAVRSLARRESIDNVIFGEMTTDDEGRITIDLAVFDRHADAVTASVSDAAESLFDIFDVADRLTVSILEGFSGVHVGFGSVRLANSGESGNYETYVDGVYVGENIPELEKVLIGKHSIEVVQTRRGEPFLLAARELEIREDARLQVDFTIPYLTDAEAELFDSFDRMVRRTWHDDSQFEAVLAEFNGIFDLLSNAGGSPAFADLRVKYQKVYDHWSVRHGERESGRRFVAGPSPEIKIDGNPSEWGEVAIAMSNQNFWSDNIALEGGVLDYIKLSVDSSGSRLYMLLRVRGGDINSNLSYRCIFDNNENGYWEDDVDRSVTIYHSGQWKVSVAGGSDGDVLQADSRVVVDGRHIEMSLDMAKAGISSAFRIIAEVRLGEHKQNLTPAQMVVMETEGEKEIPARPSGESQAAPAGELPGWPAAENRIEASKTLRLLGAVERDVASAKIPSIPYATIQIDGKVGDWVYLPFFAAGAGGTGSSPYAIDPLIEADNATRAVYIARDEQFLYIRIDSDKDISPEHWYQFNFMVDKSTVKHAYDIAMRFEEGRWRTQVRYEKRQVWVGDYNGQPILFDRCAVKGRTVEGRVPLERINVSSGDHVRINAHVDPDITKWRVIKY